MSVTYTGHTNSGGEDTERGGKKMEEGEETKGGGRRTRRKERVRVAHLLRMGSTNCGSISPRNTEH